MFKWFKKNLIALIIFFILLLVILLLSSYIFSLKKNLQEKDIQITTLKTVSQPRDPFIDYALNLKKYDPKGAKAVAFNCFERKPLKNMSPKDQWWYNTAPHDPVIPENNEKINIIQKDLREKNTEADRICFRPSTNDYLVDYRYQYEKDKYKNSAELYRFKDNFSYNIHQVSDDFYVFKVISWLNNGDLIYDLIGDTSNYHTAYVFTANNDDILLEFCGINMNDNMTASFTCKNFNNINSFSTYLPNSVLDDFVGAATF